MNWNNAIIEKYTYPDTQPAIGDNVGRITRLVEAVSGDYFNVYFRNDNDYRPDTVVKEAMLRKMKINGYFPTIAFDDRKSVVEMWRLNGLFVFQVAEGDF